MTNLNGFVDEVLVVEGFFKILINRAEVSLPDFCVVIQLIANVAE